MASSKDNNVLKKISRNSPYDNAPGGDISGLQQTNTLTKLFSNRVNAAWYECYTSLLPYDERLREQPMDEIESRDIELSLIFAYGENWREAEGDYETKKKVAVQRYRKYKFEKDKALRDEKRDREGGARSSDQQNQSYGLTPRQKKEIRPVVDLLERFQVLRNRRFIAAKQQQRKSIDSKWPLVTTKMRKLHEMFVGGHRQRVRQRFGRVISLVRCVVRFLKNIALLAGSTSELFKSAKIYMDEMIKKGPSLTEPRKEKNLFNVNRYKLSISAHTKTTCSQSIILNLTKPWYLRTESEVAKIVDQLQALRSFVSFPVQTQGHIAKCAWYISIPEDKVIIRERHEALDFYIMLSGRAVMSCFKGSPYCEERGNFEFVRMLKRDDCFGAESISDTGSSRQYSVISTGPCEVISVNVYEYKKMLLSCLEHEEAPEHIRFLGCHEIMRNFPKDILMHEGEENTTLFYFPANSVISKSMETSEYVYVVYSGSCRVIYEVPPAEEFCKTSTLNMSKRQSAQDATNAMYAFYYRRTKPDYFPHEIRLRYATMKGPELRVVSTTEQPKESKLKTVIQNSFQVYERLHSVNSESFVDESNLLDLRNRILKKSSTRYNAHGDMKRTLSKLRSVARFNSASGRKGFVSKLNVQKSSVFQSQSLDQLANDTKSIISKYRLSQVYEASPKLPEIKQKHVSIRKNVNARFSTQQEHNLIQEESTHTLSESHSENDQIFTKNSPELEISSTTVSEENSKTNISNKLLSDKDAKSSRKKLTANKSAKQSRENLVSEKSTKQSRENLASEKSSKQFRENLASEKSVKQSRENLAFEKSAKQSRENLAPGKNAKQSRENLASEKNVKRGGQKPKPQKSLKQLSERTVSKTQEKLTSGENARKPGEITRKSSAKKTSDRNLAKPGKNEASKLKLCSKESSMNDIPAMKKVSDEHLYSRWRVHRTMVKGDSIGTEWLDFNDRSFEVPDKDMTVVSDGCELIIVRRDFMLRYLGKIW